MGVRSWFRSAASGRFVARKMAAGHPSSTVHETAVATPAYPEYERTLIEQQYALRIAKDIRQNFNPLQALDIPDYIESRFGGVG